MEHLQEMNKKPLKKKLFLQGLKYGDLYSLNLQSPPPIYAELLQQKEKSYADMIGTWKSNRRSEIRSE